MYARVRKAKLRKKHRGRSPVFCGRNSMSAVFKSGLTKLGNKTALKMSLKVFGKGIMSGITADLSLDFVMGVYNFINDSLQSYKNQHNITTLDPICWCAS